MEESQSLVATTDTKPTLVASRQTYGGLVPRDIEELWRMATWIAKSGMAPKDMETPEKISVAIQMGLEVGLSPMQSVQNISVINRRPAIWGDAALGLVRASGELEKFQEWFDGTPMTDSWTAYCLVKRRGEEEDTIQEFSYAEAKAAKLVPAHPDSPWAKYPRRMLQMRARSWALRDKFTDVLKGLHVREEAADVVVMSSRPDGTYEAADERMSAKEALKQKLRPKAEIEKSPESDEDAPKSDLVQKAAPDTPKVEKRQESPAVVPQEPIKQQGPSRQELEQAWESQLYNSFKFLKTESFKEWLQNNVAKRHTWSTFIVRELNKKCQNVLGKSLVQALSDFVPRETEPTPEASSPSSSPEPPQNESIAEKIARIEETLQRDFKGIGDLTVADWMNAQWECDLGNLRYRITDPVADAILEDISDPIRSTLTAFAKM